MSKPDISTAVQEAIQGSIEGGFIEGFVGIVNYITPDGDRQFQMFSPDEQFFDRSLSMADHLYSYFREVQRLNIVGMLIEDDEDEDE